MGNGIIVKRIKGITQYYAKDHMSQFKQGDFLRIVPEFDNPYDHNALAIYDDYNHKLGYIDKYSNVEVYHTIKDVDYVCIITYVYQDYSKPSIEFEIIYRTNGRMFSISQNTFEDLVAKYKRQRHPLQSFDDSIFDIVLRNYNGELLYGSGILSIGRETFDYDQRSFQIDDESLNFCADLYLEEWLFKDKRPEGFEKKSIVCRCNIRFLENKKKDVYYYEYVEKVWLPKVRRYLSSNKAIDLIDFDGKIYLYMIIEKNTTLASFMKYTNKLTDIAERKF